MGWDQYIEFLYRFQKSRCNRITENQPPRQMLQQECKQARQVRPQPECAALLIVIFYEF